MNESIENKILLVDDEEDIRLVLGMSLADMGYDVLTADNGEQALEIFKEEQPPIVLTDIKMPGMDGIELLRKIKMLNPETEVIMITGHGDMDLAITSFKDEASDFITKPVDVDALDVAIQRVREKILIRQKLRDYTTHLESLLAKKADALRNVQQLDDKISKDLEPQTVQGRFGDIFNQLPCYITIQDRDFTFTSVNNRFKEDFGDETGSKCYHVWRQRNEPCDQCPVLKSFEDGQSHQMEVEFIAKSARRINILVWTSPVRNPSGDITHVMVMATNIDQVLNFQDHLSSLGLLIGSVSHGIKGLLTGLDGGLYLLDSGLSKQDNKQTKEGLDITKQMVARIRNMVLDILFYAKDRELNREQIDVAAFAEDVAGVIEPKLNKQSIQMVKDFRQPLGTFNVDTGFLHSALVNILENAMDACTDDKLKTNHCIIFVVEKLKDEILFEISDNGIGMDEKTVSQMFNMFFSAKGKQGTGLGLFITQRIVKQHGGEIKVNSAKGKGTTMTVQIPITISLSSG
jgi:signal transduction histidine kinase/FixJ family two-component response regulator